MKARPRRVENRVAEEISKFLSEYDLPEVERIPVLGRTGPDISVWPAFKVAVDVKSRKANPKGYKIGADFKNDYGIKHWWGYGDTNYGEAYGNADEMVGARLCDLNLLFDTENICLNPRPSSKTVTKWLAHMLAWCTEQWKKKDFYCLPALVLHWPGTPVKDSTFVIYKEDRRALNDRRQRLNDLRLRAGYEYGDDNRFDGFEALDSHGGPG
jgi:hypothetical protein